MDRGQRQQDHDRSPARDKDKTDAWDFEIALWPDLRESPFQSTNWTSYGYDFPVSSSCFAADGLLHPMVSRRDGFWLPERLEAGVWRVWASWQAIMISGLINEILVHKSPQLWTISPEASVFEAIQIMADRNTGALLVMRGERLVGVISERDYTRKVALKGKNSKETKVGDIVDPSPVSVEPTHTVEHAMKLMTSHRVRHLPVLERDKLVGIVSIGDLVNWVIQAQTSTIHQLESYITGHYPGSD
jgi:CBS domain-containing protein